MNEDELRQARLNNFAGLLHERIRAYCVGRMLDSATVLGLKEIVDQARSHARVHEGLDFPPMHVIAFPRLGAIEIVRKDLDERSLQTWIVNLTVKYPGITPIEIARALKDAFPNYRVDATARRQ